MTVIKIPCELKKPLIIDGHPCKYLLDLIDGEVYGTDNFALFHLYDGMFFETKPTEHDPIERSFQCRSNATPEAWKQGMEQEKKRYEEGYHYISEWVTIRGEKWKKGRWVKDV